MIMMIVLLVQSNTKSGTYEQRRNQGTFHSSLIELKKGLLKIFSLIAIICSSCKSYFPLIKRYFTPGKSGTRPPRIKTTEYSCKLWPSPGIYYSILGPLANFILATFLKAVIYYH